MVSPRKSQVTRHRGKSRPWGAWEARTDLSTGGDMGWSSSCEGGSEAGHGELRHHAALSDS